MYTSDSSTNKLFVDLKPRGNTYILRSTKSLFEKSPTLFYVNRDPRGSRTTMRFNSGTDHLLGHMARLCFTYCLNQRHVERIVHLGSDVLFQVRDVFLRESLRHAAALKRTAQDYEELSRIWC